MNTHAGVVEHLFRHSAGQITATLARTLGTAGLDLAEEAVSDALEQALRTWPHTGVPDNARGWLFRAARNRAVDLLRREAVLQAKLPALVELEACPESGAQDAELALMLLCCHPDLPMTSQVALTLKTVGGLGVPEIASALLTSPATVAKRITRAKSSLRTAADAVELPSPEAVPDRVDSVLAVLYLLFNEGYGASSGDAAVRGELCAEAIRLARLLLSDPSTDLPKARALLALMQLQASRLPARVDESGDLLLLDEQDRDRWDHTLIAEGTAMFAVACTGPELSAYHVEAAIALCHAAAGEPGQTDWQRVLELYEQLLRLRPSPVIRLNRAIAVAMVHGPDAGIAELRLLEGDVRLRDYPPLPAALGALSLRAGRPDEAARYYDRALGLPGSEPQRRFLRKRLAECAARSE
ncbi:RNA polymerase sigma-70 factor, ECF subfamily [Amycolatopsis marina]|uniref:RNA polymerase sigma-70 factor, ECF subfamily n=1 Tax=Amycolatopsis marina TaxID=490629 RepID=A0A1I0VTM4_9PSEU|nr:DUF6596 domain-containing protein [Amycolatopsis marina]SFA79548.1 RNA polymerase sigma-70 factor, ECF subfamily [Amycolatopsis marina]